MTQILWYFQAGGLLMWPLLLCSLVALAVIIERTVRLNRSRLIDPRVVEDIQTSLERGQVEEAITRHRDSPTLVGRILSKGLNEYVSTHADLETSLVDAGQRGLGVLSANLSILNLIARIAPLIGLLGTVLGMIAGFEELEAEGMRKQQLAGAIRIALVTTATGLMIAIPTLVASAYFRSRVQAIVAEFEEIFIDVLKTARAAGMQDTATSSKTRELARAQPSRASQRSEEMPELA